MARLTAWIQKEAVLVIAAACALLSAFFVPPSADYLGYINWQVLALLFCLMSVVAGFRETGVFGWLSMELLTRTRQVKAIAMILVLLCFFLSMLITNDVALITFVPLTMGLFEKDRGDRLIFIIVMETVAANLGSLVTPIGNPQNLYLYSVYHYDIGSFLSVTLPLGGFCLALVVLIMLFMPRGVMQIVAFAPSDSAAPSDPKSQARRAKAGRIGGVDAVRSLKFLVLFAVCLLCVLKVLHFGIVLGIVAAALLLSDRKIFLRVDYSLLLTFICFFIFVGNVSRIEAVRSFLSQILAGREMAVSALISQVVSNVPAAVMLSSFTDKADALVRGTNIGGLGTLIASLASLISYRLYSTGEHARKSRYLVVFSLVNAVLFAAVLGFALLVF